MKKIYSILLIILAFSLLACSKSEDKKDNSKTKKETTTTTSKKVTSSDSKFEKTCSDIRASLTKNTTAIKEITASMSSDPSHAIDNMATILTNLKTSFEDISVQVEDLEFSDSSKKETQQKMIEELDELSMLMDQIIANLKTVGTSGKTTQEITSVFATDLPKFQSLMYSFASNVSKLGLDNCYSNATDK